jgi:DNA-binding NtrC family response regulator
MPYRALFVDDQEVILVAMRKFFTLRGYEVDCATELEQARMFLDSHKYALVITDLRLTSAQGAEGLEVVKKVRSVSPEAGVIMLTAYGSPEMVIEAARQGVDILLHKPQPLKEIVRVAQELLEARKSEQGA